MVFANITNINETVEETDYEDWVSKRDVTNAVVIGSIFAILVTLFLLLCSITYCWFRYYQICSVKNRLVIRGKSYQFVEDDEEQEIENHESNNLNSNYKFESSKFVSPHLINNTSNLTADDENEKINSNNQIDEEDDEFCNTLLLQKLALENDQNAALSITDKFSSKPIKLGQIVVVIKPINNLDKGDLLRVIDIDLQSESISGVLMSNYLEITNESIRLKSRRFKNDEENTTKNLIKTLPIDHITLETSLISALESN